MSPAVLIDLEEVLGEEAALGSRDESYGATGIGVGIMPVILIFLVLLPLLLVKPGRTGSAVTTVASRPAPA